MSTPKVVLKARRAQPFFGRHPWVYAGAIDRIDGSPADGDEVELVSTVGNFVARGLFNSQSKIRLVHDGVLILNTILALFRDYKPLTFFGTTGLIFVSGGLAPGAFVILDFLKTGLVVHLPLAVLAVGLVLSGMLLIVAGLILHTNARHFQELAFQMRQFAARQDRATGSLLGQTRRSIS